MFKNKYIFYRIWKKKEPDELDKECDGFSAKQLFKLCRAVEIPQEKEFENLEKMLKEIEGKPLIAGIRHDVYNEKKQEKVSFTAVSKFPKCNHEFKKDDSKSENKSIEIEMYDDLPF